MATHSSILACRIPMDKGARWAAAHGVTEIREQDTTERLSMSVCQFQTPSLSLLPIFPLIGIVFASKLKSFKKNKHKCNNREIIFFLGGGRA